MNKFLKRIMLYLSASKTKTGSETIVDYSGASFDYSYTASTVNTLNEAESFGGFNEGDFGGAGAGDSWSDSSSDDSGDGGGDSGGDSGSD